jgi:uncharacterized protein
VTENRSTHAPDGPVSEAERALAELLQVPESALRSLDADIAAAGGPLARDPRAEGAFGFTMFDAPSSEDKLVTVLLSHEEIERIPSQSLVRIRSKDNRSYLGTVVAGPFAEPDGFRADSTILVTVVTRGGIFVPPFHGRVQVELLGEESNGELVPPRYRPLPNSPVFVLDEAETAMRLQVAGDIQLGRIIGLENISVGVPSTRKDVLPRHTAILGTTGGGKSTTVARLVEQAQSAGCAVILLDVEGEYAFLHQPTTDTRMQAALGRRGLQPAGIPDTRLYHLIGRDTANPGHPRRSAFYLQFGRPSPHAVAEILDLTDAQRERFMQAYDIAKALVRELGIFPRPGHPEDERQVLELDEFDRGYPRLTLSVLMDVVTVCRMQSDIEGSKQSKKKDAESGNSHAEQAFADYEPWSAELKTAKDRLFQRIGAAGISGNAVSWRALLAKLGGLNRLRVFDRQADMGAEVLRYKPLLHPGCVSIVDLSDSGSPVLNNLVIADLLRGVQADQEEAYEQYEQARRKGDTGVAAPTRVLIVIEEAHEFLSGDRETKMPVLFEQVTRIARRGRKRWLGLVFVTQLPQHLPRQIFGLVNSYVLHKIADPQVVSTLQRTVSGIDDSLWKRLPGLAPGQAIVAFPHLARPLLVAIDPSPAELRLVD